MYICEKNTKTYISNKTHDIAFSYQQLHGESAKKKQNPDTCNITALKCVKQIKIDSFSL